MRIRLSAVVLGLVLIAFIIRPRLGHCGRAQYIMLAAFFAATCHVYTLSVSFINVSTPRFLMAVYPQLVLVAVLVLSGFFRRTESFQSSAFAGSTERAALPPSAQDRKAAVESVER